jgi:dienelactone hydrolase
MMRFLSLLIVVLLVPAAAIRADNLAAERRQILELGGLTAAPEMHPAEGFADGPGMRAVFYDSLPWKGKPTKVFAWLGLPTNATGKVPGVVLVHGGGGSAFKEWVRRWNERGFAAISISVEGQTDRSDPELPKGTPGYRQHAWAGPERNGIYGDSEAPLADQWIYHAVADTVLANSLLRSLPEVDADKIGVMGISWGGVITATAIGIDDRFAFAIPMYGCGSLSDEPNQYGRTLGTNTLYRQAWDPMVRMDRVKLPVLWFSWPQDQHFPLDCQAALITTTDSGFTGNREWTESPASMERQGDGWIVTAPLPAGTTAWFVNVHSGDLVASSDYQERK